MKPEGRGLTPAQARRKSDEWGRAVWEWRELKGLNGYANWDRQTPAVRAQLERMLEEGYDNITREKLGGPVA